MDAVLSNSSSSPWTVHRWARLRDISQYIERKTGKTDAWTRDVLKTLVEQGDIQTTTYGGGRFYADTTYSFSYPISIMLSLLGWLLYVFTVRAFPPLPLYPMFFTPLLYAILDHRLRNRRETGICLECGQVIPTGETYCSEECRNKRQPDTELERIRRRFSGYKIEDHIRVNAR